MSNEKVPVTLAGVEIGTAVILDDGSVAIEVDSDKMPEDFVANLRKNYTALNETEDPTIFPPYDN